MESGIVFSREKRRQADLDACGYGGGGQLAAVATLDGTDMSLIDPKLEGAILTFKLQVNDH